MKALMMSLLLLVLAYPASYAEALDIPDSYAASPVSVHFYPGGARFEFLITPDSSDGSFEAYLPGAFTPESVKPVNTQNITGDLRAVRISRTKWTPSQLEDLKSDYDLQAQTVNNLTADQASLEQTLSLLKSINPEKSEKPSELLDYIKNAQELRRKTETDLAALKTELATEREKLTMLSSELNARRPSGESSYIVVTGRAKGKGVRITAETGAASWRPRYTLDMDSTSGDIAVSMFVRAQQRTGLDYSGAFTLHTKTPDENISTPELMPLRVSIKPKQERVLATSGMSITRTNRMYKSAQMEAAVMDEDFAEDSAPMAAMMPTQAPAIEETMTDRVVNVRGTLTGDGKEGDYQVQTDITLKAKPVIVLVPEQDTKAWIIASMDEGNSRLIPGIADLRVDGIPSGKIYVQEFGEGQRQIPFGYIDQITIKKESLVGKTGVSWFSGVLTSGYKLEITNGTNTDHVITVRDRLPIPTDDKIKLDVKRIEPKEKERDAENRMKWEINVPAGKTETIIVDYTLSYPSGEELEYK